MINKYTNKQRGLLAVIMAMVMVFAGAAFVAAEVDATPTISSDGKVATVGNLVDFKTAIETDGVEKIEVTERLEMPTTGDLTIDLKGLEIVVSDNKGFITLNGNNDQTLTIIDSVGGGKITTKGAGATMFNGYGANGTINLVIESGTFESDYCIVLFSNTTET